MSTNVPTRAQLRARAADVVPVLQKYATWSEEHRRLHDDVLEAMSAAGIFRLRTPARYGGYECDARTLIEVATELARGDGSAAWTASVYWIPTWMAAQFPDEVQDEVFTSPSTRICGTLSPSATATPVDGGVVVNGRWGFISGALHSQWQAIIAVQLMPQGPPLPVVALVPMADLQVIDDWHTHALHGTGSVSTVAQDLFVPQARVLPLPAILDGQGASRANVASAIYQAPLLPVASASSVGTAVGLAKAARDVFLERLPGRKITYTTYDSQGAAPLTHLQVAEAVTKVDQAEFHAQRLATTLDQKAADRQSWTLDERVRARADLGAACRLAKESVDILAGASGGSSVYADVPIQRIHHDIDAINLHALMHPNTNAELFGRFLCGLEPNTSYL
ncbi:acyl-CoA dehydrogenase family protein [Solwaraspora sp. WMMA2056]|uniref:acyl-CoA dehydrogenase family protein n=1 Tax=Solwaraspora sp. WMMA2056 TaxID=3015161 RepID=UPI00259B9EDC|nr:acyl-CoA dehydrogenase family protein [Solwaraspora sp. WMMA2056]WJK42573.1 acyl-CoA dehydrogenase family protein [Solwaraspora sp. WMMA2056]